MKLSVQLFSISSLCMLGWIPYGILSTMQIFFSTPTAARLLATYFIYFPYIQSIFLPYASLMFMNEIRQKLLTLLCYFNHWKKICHTNKIHTTVHM